MSRKKIFFPVALFFTSTALLLFSFQAFAGADSGEEAGGVYVEPDEVKTFFTIRKQNREAAAVTLEESRKIASDWIKKERSKINNRFFYRRRSYELISKAILTSKSYEELNYHLARLPETEKQAYATLTIDRANITTMNNYRPAIPGTVYPVEIPGRINNGEDLLITSYYSNRRISPFGSGGVKPHLAVDIINIGNIDYISRKGELVREGNHPGYLVSIADGVVKSVEYNHIYGWNVTVEHNADLIPYQRRRGVKSFETFYSHMDKHILVKSGDSVLQGQRIAALGNSGLSTGPHLHFEVRFIKEDGKIVHINPYPGSEW